MSTDNDPTIGLNEVALGIVPPKWWAAVMRKIVGEQQAETFLVNATLLKPQQAVQVGLIHQAVSSEELLPAAKSYVSKSLRLPDRARAATKMSLRKDIADGWLGELEGDIQQMWKFLNMPAMRKNIDAVIQRLG